MKKWFFMAMVALTALATVQMSYKKDDDDSQEESFLVGKWEHIGVYFDDDGEYLMPEEENYLDIAHVSDDIYTIRETYYNEVADSMEIYEPQEFKMYLTYWEFTKTNIIQKYAMFGDTLRAYFRTNDNGTIISGYDDYLKMR